jgi:DNA-binding transcriptional MerR regulator
MNLDEKVFENADAVAATGLSATTLQTWATRGILALSKEQQNPGVGAKRLYSALDIARIAATKAFIDRGLTNNAAVGIALRLERSPQSSQTWRKALEHLEPRIHVFVGDDMVVVGVYVGNDAEASNRLSELSEPSEGGVLGQPTQILLNASRFDVGPEVRSAMQTLRKLRKLEGPFTT